MHALCAHAPGIPVAETLTPEVAKDLSYNVGQQSRVMFVVPTYCFMGSADLRMHANAVHVILNPRHVLRAIVASVAGGMRDWYINSGNACTHVDVQTHVLTRVGLGPFNRQTGVDSVVVPDGN